MGAGEESWGSVIDARELKGAGFADAAEPELAGDAEDDANPVQSASEIVHPEVVKNESP